MIEFPHSHNHITSTLPSNTGHGAPGILACLWLEGSISKFMPDYTCDRAGLEKLITRFSAPGGFPSHINAETPGCIHEGGTYPHFPTKCYLDRSCFWLCTGELGYALSVSFGAVMDKPDLVVVCVVGDGEAETGPTATYVLTPRSFPLTNVFIQIIRSAWHAYKYIDPAESGAVLPIVNVNGFKISERTIYGTMDDKEMTALFT